MDALHVWSALLPFNWAVKPSGTVFPYFCSILEGDSKPVRIRLLMLEGWQTMHDYVRSRADRNFGCCSEPFEFPHFELVLLASGEIKLIRCDPVYVPIDASEQQRELCSKILWESYGLFMRMETDPKLPMKYADERAVFARVEKPDGTWSDEPLEIPDPRPYVEKISFDKEDLKLAKDLPFASNSTLDVDFHVIPNEITREAPRPRSVYKLVARDSGKGEDVFMEKLSASPDGGLKRMWEVMPSRLLKQLVKTGSFPGHIRVRSGRVFRFLRPLCMELPFKLSLHDSLPGLQ